MDGSTLCTAFMCEEKFSLWCHLWWSHVWWLHSPLSVSLSACVCVFLPPAPCVFLTSFLSVCLSVCLCLSVLLSVSLFICLSVCLFLSFCLCLFLGLAVCIQDLFLYERSLHEMGSELSTERDRLTVEDEDQSKAVKNGTDARHLRHWQAALPLTAFSHTSRVQSDCYLSPCNQCCPRGS